MIHIDSVCRTLANNIRKISIRYPDQDLVLHPEVASLDDTIDIQNGFMVVGYNSGDKVFKLRIKSDDGKSDSFEYDADSVLMLLDDIDEEMHNYFGVKRQVAGINEKDVKGLMRPGW